MARSVNKATLIGNVGQAPEVRSTANGGKVATFSVATSTEWTDAQGAKQERTQWHRCVVWNRGAKGGLADVVEKYVNKGDKIYVEGMIEYRDWTDKENNKRTSTEIRVEELTLLGGNPAARDGAAPRQARPAQTAKPAAAAEEFAGFPGGAGDDGDEELPF